MCGPFSVGPALIHFFTFFFLLSMIYKFVVVCSYLQKGKKKFEWVMSFIGFTMPIMHHFSPGLRFP